MNRFDEKSLDVMVSVPWMIVYEGEGEGGDGGKGGEGEGKGKEGEGKGKEGEAKTFTQEDVNRFMAEEKRKTQAAMTKLNTELDALKQRSSMTQKERDELTAKIEEMQTSLLTKEELAKRDLDKANKNAQKEKEDLTKDRDSWKEKFISSSINTSLTQAAVEGKAYNPEQVIAILRPTTRLVEVMDEDGKPTGEYETKVKLSTLSDKGEPLTLDLHPKEAVKRMSESEAYANLFIEAGTGGLGLKGKSEQKGKLNLAEVAKDPEKYRKLRKEGKINFDK